MIESAIGLVLVVALMYGLAYGIPWLYHLVLTGDNIWKDMPKQRTDRDPPDPHYSDWMG